MVAIIRRWMHLWAWIIGGMYVLTAIGLSVSVHWCHGKIAYVKIEGAHEAMPRCGCKVPKPCCKDEQVTVALHTPHIPSSEKVDSQRVSPTVMCIIQSVLGEVGRDEVTVATSISSYRVEGNCLGTLPSAHAFIFAFRS